MSFMFFRRFCIIFFTVGMCFFSVPTFFNCFNNLPKVNLGLDLRGGSSILFGIDTEDVISSYLSDNLQRIRIALRKNNVKFKSVKIENKKIIISLADDIKVDEVLKFLEKEARVSYKNLGIIEVSITDEYSSKIIESAIKRSIDVLNKRVNEFGTSESHIISYGTDKILVEVPGIFNLDKLKAILGKTAQLGFHIVKNIVPKGSKMDVLSNFKIIEGEGDYLYVVEKMPHLSGERLVDAQISFGQYGEPVVSFAFDSIGSRVFADLTSKNIGQRLAIVFDDYVLSSPSINTAILGGSGIIQGNFTIQSATDLALMMRSGSLPAKLEILEEKIIGPGLGEESIKSGAFATILSILVVILLIFFMYKSFGIFTNIALIFNLFLIISFLAILNIVLTLPGIAGIALTLGMAVDANILINERIREEMKKTGKLINSINLGYSMAKKTIIDSNITTIIGASFLMIFGSGPIKGFAITLIIGILTSMFTSVVLSKTLVNIWFEKKLNRFINFSL